MAPRNEEELEQQAAQELHVEIIPGTEIMRDVGSIHFTHAKGSDTVLLPHPTSDPKDPLNWSKKWKLIVIIVNFLNTFITVASGLSIAPMSPLLMEEFSIDEQAVGLLTGVIVLTNGYANFVIVPCSNIFGRRFTCLIFGVVTVATQIWIALSHSYNSLLAARAVNGFATAINESIMVQVVADMFFVHERGVWTGIYFTAYFFGLFIGPVISGNMGVRYGWRTFFWLATGLASLCLILLLVLFPETKYHREHVRPAQATSNRLETPPSEKADAPEQMEVDSVPLEAAQTAGSNGIVGEGGPGKGNFALIQRPDHRWKTFLIRDTISPLRVFFYPIIFWAGLLVAGPANTLLFWNLTESAVLSAPPYNWNGGKVGNANFAFVVGGFVGLVTAGPFSDWIANWSTRRNNGVREAEMRLPALIPYGIIAAIGIVIGGLGYERLWAWPTFIVVGYGFTGLLVTTVPTIAIAYAIDCYKPISGEIMVVATVLKNTCGFGMSYWVAPLAAKYGFLRPTMVQFSLVIGPILLGIPLYFFGKSLRRLTANSNLHRLEEIL